MEHDFEPIKIAEAEGRYAAKAMIGIDMNPYDRSYAGLYAAWENGFIAELLWMRTELKQLKQFAGKQREEIHSLRRNVEELELQIREINEQLAEV